MGILNSPDLFSGIVGVILGGLLSSLVSWIIHTKRIKYEFDLSLLERLGQIYFTASKDVYGEGVEASLFVRSHVVALHAEFMTIAKISNVFNVDCVEAVEHHYRDLRDLILRSGRVNYAPDERDKFIKYLSAVETCAEESINRLSTRLIKPRWGGRRQLVKA